MKVTGTKGKVSLSSEYTNPEFTKSADRFIETIKHDLAVVKGQNPDKNQIMDIATKILESRLQ